MLPSVAILSGWISCSSTSKKTNSPQSAKYQDNIIEKLRYTSEITWNLQGGISHINQLSQNLVRLMSEQMPPFLLVVWKRNFKHLTIKCVLSSSKAAL